jgi:hypothetical protein
VDRLVLNRGLCDAIAAIRRANKRAESSPSSGLDAPPDDHRPAPAPLASCWQQLSSRPKRNKVIPKQEQPSNRENRFLAPWSKKQTNPYNFKLESPAIPKQVSNNVAKGRNRVPLSCWSKIETDSSAPAPANDSGRLKRTHHSKPGRRIKEKRKLYNERQTRFF